MVTALQDMRACRERLDSKADAQALREALQHQHDMDTRLTGLQVGGGHACMHAGGSDVLLVLTAPVLVLRDCRVQEEYSSWRAETRAILTEINRELEQTAPLEEVGNRRTHSPPLGHSRPPLHCPVYRQ